MVQNEESAALAELQAKLTTKPEEGEKSLASTQEWKQKQPPLSTRKWKQK